MKKLLSFNYKNDEETKKNDIDDAVDAELHDFKLSSKVLSLSNFLLTGKWYQYINILINPRKNTSFMFA